MKTLLATFFIRRGWSKQSLAWAAYDWANSGFATIIIAGIFPIFYRQQWASDLPQEEASLSFALMNSASGVLLVLSAPLLGAIADTSNLKKAMLVVCALLGAVITAAFAWVPSGEWLIAAVLYVWAVFFFMAGNVFYDALLTDVAAVDDYNRVSTAGYAIGYLGGGLVLVLSVWLIWNGQLLGANSEQMTRVSFLITGLWWALFSIPLIRYVRERRNAKTQRLRQGVQQFMRTIQLLRNYPNAGWFLVAYWLYIDGVDTVIRMAVFYGQTIGFGATDLLIALLIVQFVGFPATLVYGWLAQRVGNVVMIMVGICGYIVICLWGAMIETLSSFYLLATLIALLQGGLQAQSRAFFASLIPHQHSAQFFGLYNLLGRFAVVIGPLLVGLVGLYSGGLRMGIASVSLLLIAGLWVFYRKVLQPSSR